MEEDGAAAEKAPAADAFATSQEEPTPSSSSSSTKSPFDPCISAATAAATSPGEILRALQVVERDSVAIAESYASLFSSLRIALSEVTSTSLENMQCFNDVVGRLQESALDAATKGNRYINSCLRLNEEMKSLESLALQLWKKDIKEERGQSGCGCKPSTPTSLSRHHLRAFEDEFYRSLKDAVMEVHKKDTMNCGS